MTPDALEPDCRRCGAPLASDQLYCLRCGSLRDAGRPAWRRPLLAAAITLTVCALAFGAVYLHLGSRADDEAAANDVGARPALAAGDDQPSWGQ